MKNVPEIADFSEYYLATLCREIIKLAYVGYVWIVVNV